MNCRLVQSPLVIFHPFHVAPCIASLDHPYSIAVFPHATTRFRRVWSAAAKRFSVPKRNPPRLGTQARPTRSHCERTGFLMEDELECETKGPWDTEGELWS